MTVRTLRHSKAVTTRPYCNFFVSESTFLRPRAEETRTSVSSSANQKFLLGKSSERYRANRTGKWGEVSFVPVACFLIAHVDRSPVILLFLQHGISSPARTKRQIRLKMAPRCRLFRRHPTIHDLPRPEIPR